MSMASQPDPSDPVLIVAPHPDDETLGCAGVILRARRSAGRVRVVFLTNGDGFPDATAVHTGKAVEALAPRDFLEVARVRQQGAVDATRALGLDRTDLVFLSYPDSGLAGVLAATGETPYTQRFTGQSATYGLLFEDYHTQMYGRPAPYLVTFAVGDLADQIRAFRPLRIYITGAGDSHSDHRAGLELVRAAAAEAGYAGAVYTYLVHAEGGHWPLPPGATPTRPFDVEIVNGQQVPAGVRWPPDHRVPLTREEARLKHEAIRAYALEMRILGPYVESFVKSEEVFWDDTPGA